MKTDLAIIGAGPGGYVAALRAAQLGMEVALVECAHLGGICLNRGCIPTKAMVQTALVAHEVRKAGAFGVLVDTPPRIDYAVALDRRDAVVKRLRNGVRGLLKHQKVQVLQGRAAFAGPQTLIVEPVPVDIGAGKGAALTEAQTLEAGHIIVATGSKPLALSVPGAGHPRVLDSDGALALTEVPSSILVVGAGSIGCEWSQIFARLGAEVTLVEMLPAVLPRADAAISLELAKALRGEGVVVHTGTSIAGVTDPGSELEVRLIEVTGGAETTVKAEYVLVGAGRAPLTDGLDLEAAGVKTDSKGWIATDQYQRTSVPSILAIGDVTGGALLAHVAYRQGIVAVETLAGLSPDPVRDDRVPSITYTDPEVASVGLTEAQARQSDPAALVGTFVLSANGRAVAQGADQGLVKVVADSRYGRVLGVHMIGAHMGEMLGEAVLALELEATLDELGSVIRSHPTLSEALGEACLAAQGRALHV
ncbi:MAG: dihydrolipoyl dehydrogenase [Thermoleophilia bacterium]|nr:dihydrolipoyl dehydrogenase [Thermoleophilia bacterium]